jgi:flagellar basal body-associated protein FliL
LFPGSVLAVALCWFGWKKRRGLQMTLLVLIALGLSLCTGCSLGVWYTPQAATQDSASTVTVIATSGSLQPTTTFTLTVQ